MNAISQPTAPTSDDQVIPVNEAEEQAYWLAMRIPFSTGHLAEALNTILSRFPTARPITDLLWKAAMNGLEKAKVIRLQISRFHFDIK